MSEREIEFLEIQLDLYITYFQTNSSLDLLTAFHTTHSHLNHKPDQTNAKLKYKIRIPDRRVASQVFYEGNLVWVYLWLLV